MEIKQFNKETNRLTKYYDKEYNEYQLKEIYNAIKEISIEHYRRIVNEALKTEKYLPKLVEILELKEKTEIQDNTYKPPVENKQVKCEHCKGSGLIKFYEKRNGGIEYEFLARCKCENAKQYDNWLDDKGNNLFPSAIQLNLI